VASSAFDTFELTAQSGQHVKYTMTVTSTGGCAMLLFVKGHNVNPSSQYYVAYSQENCVSSYSNDFPVASSDGTTFSVVVLTQQSQNVDYSVTIQTYSPAIPDWVLGVVVFLGIVVAVSAIPRVRGLVYLGLGVATHLLLDLVWEQPWIALWPAMGTAFPPGTLDVVALLTVLWTNPVVLAGELVGTGILIAFARSQGITTWRALVQFLRNGTPSPSSSV